MCPQGDTLCEVGDVHAGMVEQVHADAALQAMAYILQCGARLCQLMRRILVFGRGRVRAPALRAGPHGVAGRVSSTWSRGLHTGGRLVAPFFPATNALHDVTMDNEEYVLRARSAYR